MVAAAPNKLTANVIFVGAGCLITAGITVVVHSDFLLYGTAIHAGIGVFIILFIRIGQRPSAIVVVDTEIYTIAAGLANFTARPSTAGNTDVYKFYGLIVQRVSCSVNRFGNRFATACASALAFTVLGTGSFLKDYKIIEEVSVRVQNVGKRILTRGANSGDVTVGGAGRFHSFGFDVVVIRYPTHISANVTFGVAIVCISVRRYTHEVTARKITGVITIAIKEVFVRLYLADTAMDAVTAVIFVIGYRTNKSAIYVVTIHIADVIKDVGNGASIAALVTIRVTVVIVDMPIDHANVSAAFNVTIGIASVVEGMLGLASKSALIAYVIAIVSEYVFGITCEFTACKVTVGIASIVEDMLVRSNLAQAAVDAIAILIFVSECGDDR